MTTPLSIAEMNVCELSELMCDYLKEGKVEEAISISNDIHDMLVLILLESKDAEVKHKDCL